jgi:hypothetical protein
MCKFVQEVVSLFLPEKGEEKITKFNENSLDKLKYEEIKINSFSFYHNRRNQDFYL